MAVIAPPFTARTDRPRSGGGPGRGARGPDGAGGAGGRHPLPQRHCYTGMWMALAAVTMVFAAFTSAYIVRKGLGGDWQSLSLPSILWPNTALLLLSSGSLEMARRRLGEARAFVRWWGLTLLLGLAFLAGQLVAWRQLAQQGVYVDSYPASSFFFVLTASHGLHLLGGVLGLLYVLWRVKRPGAGAPAPTLVGVTALYWHFMDGLWIYLLLLLLIWR